MSELSPLTDDGKRRRRARGDVVEDGEYVSFSLAFRDSAPSKTHAFSADASAAVTNVNALRIATGRGPVSINARQQQILDEVAHEDAERRRKNDAAVAAAIERYAPRAEITTDSASLTSAAAVRDAARQARYQPASPSPPPSPPVSNSEGSRLTAAAAFRDAARAARYR